MTTAPPVPTPAPSDPGTDMRVPERPLDDQAPGRRSIFSTGRTGLVASVLCHAALILWAVGIWDSARPLAAMPPQSIAVDLVPSKDAPAEPGQPGHSNVDEQASTPLPDTPRSSTTADQSGDAPFLSARTLAPETGADSIDGQVALATRLAQTLQLPVVLPGGGVEMTTVDSSAKLPRDIIADFKAHLSRCWNAAPAPAGPPRLRVTIQVALKRDGRFLKDPMLIQAVASPQGPALVKSALNALQQCQPYAFLPADKYDQWKVLDLSFSPQGIL